MIVTIDSFEKYRAFIQDISRDPFFCDPHFTYDPDNLYGSLHRKDESAFAVVTDGTVQGLFVWLILPDRRYMEMLIGLTRSEAAFSEMLSHLAESYPGYQADFVLNPKNTALFRVLTGKGAYFDREQQKMLLTGRINGLCGAIRGKVAGPVPRAASHGHLLDGGARPFGAGAVPGFPRRGGPAASGIPGRYIRLRYK